MIEGYFTLYLVPAIGGGERQAEPAWAIRLLAYYSAQGEVGRESCLGLGIASPVLVMGFSVRSVP